MTKHDDISARILRVLAREGRIANTELAERVGLSPSACLRRVQDLERSGAIRGYRAVIDPAVRGGGVLAYVTVGLNEHTKGAQQAFEKAMALCPEVRECHNITGNVGVSPAGSSAPIWPPTRSFTPKGSGCSRRCARSPAHIVMGSPKDERA